MKCQILIPPCVVLIHGGHAGSWVWDALRSHLRCESVATDLPGHGQSTEGLIGLTVADCAKTVLQAIAPEQPLVIVGHSLGAAIALALCKRLGERVRHVVILAGPVPKPGNSIVSSFPFLARLASKVVLSFCPGEFSANQEITKATLLNGLQPDLAERVAKRFSKESLSLVLDPVQWSISDSTQITYIQCLRDKGPLPPKYQLHLASRLGQRVSVLPIDACHYAMIEKPAELAAMIDAVSSSTMPCLA